MPDNSENSGDSLYTVNCPCGFHRVYEVLDLVPQYCPSCHLNFADLTDWWSDIEQLGLAPSKLRPAFGRFTCLACGGVFGCASYSDDARPELCRECGRECDRKHRFGQFLAEQFDKQLLDGEPMDPPPKGLLSVGRLGRTLRDQGEWPDVVLEDLLDAELVYDCGCSHCAY